MKKIFFSFFMLAITTGYSQISFKAEVSGTGQPIILIPGYACSGDVWKETVNNLKSKYQLHVITIAGFAGVSPIDTPILATVKSDLVKYVKDNHLNKPVLIGHGMGAFLCLWAASTEPSLFSKILVVDGLPFISAINNPSATQQEKNNTAYNAETSLNILRNMSQKKFEETQFKGALRLVNDSAHARLITRWSEESDRKTLAYTLAELSSTDLRSNLAKINIPVLVLGSTYGTKKASQKIFSEQFNMVPDKRIFIAPTKSFIMYDDPLWFGEQVKNFLLNGLAD